MNARLLVAVVGAGGLVPEHCDADVAAQAEAVGRALAEAGAAIVCGGREGVMEAACRGAKSAGGTTIGILPGVDRCAANPYIDLPIVTGMGQARNLIVVYSSQAVVAVDGSYGTLSEIAHALKAGIPVVGLGTWGLASGGREVDAIHRVSDPEEAARVAVELARGRLATKALQGSKGAVAQGRSSV
jgi:uncharacterized protein (TIGR00725 family)